MARLSNIEHPSATGEPLLRIETVPRETFKPVYTTTTHPYSFDNSFNRPFSNYSIPNHREFIAIIIQTQAAGPFILLTANSNRVC
jgi:hypothetical protein